MSSEDSDDINDNDIFGDVTFDNVTRDTIQLSYSESPDFFNHNATRRTYRRQDFDSNTRTRFEYDVEMFCYLRFYIMTYILSILRSCPSRLMIWISAG